MTLDPVFRSMKAVAHLREEGFLERMADSIAAQREATEHIHALLPGLLAEEYVLPAAAQEDELAFLQGNFFQILFHSVLQTLGCSQEHLRLYARMNLCIKGIVTAGDNLFDDEAKMLLALRLPSAGPKFASILQMLCFLRILDTVCEDAVMEGSLPIEASRAARREILSRLAGVGALEGSEEDGVDEILPVEEMVERVHRVRGGALFSLAFAAPNHIEAGDLSARLRLAEDGIRDLGTAFQIADDLTDFEFDMGRRSHNLLVSEAYHSEDPAARAAIRELLGGAPVQAGMPEGVFAACARSVLARAETQGRAAFDKLASLGFWFRPELSHHLVHAIVGENGVERMERIASAG